MTATQWSRYVRSVRESTGLSQEGLARKLGLAHATVNRWERGHQVPPVASRIGYEQQMAALAKATTGPRKLLA